MYPVLFNSDFFTLYSYPLFMGLAWGVGYFLTLAQFEKAQIDPKQLLPLFIGIFISAWIGAKIFFLLVTPAHLAEKYLFANYFWLGGGFVFYGGLIFGLIFFLTYSFWLKKFDFSKSYLLVPGLVMGHAIGRVGCFLAGCCYGSQCDLPWSMTIDGVHRHPVQLYEAFYLLAFGIYILKRTKSEQLQRTVASSYLIYYSVGRFILEYFRGDDIRGLYWLNLSTSQYVSVFLFLTGIVWHFSFRAKLPIKD
jgi:phosphatidylglycerol:prolipoprotein diacylglycerol transferase